MFCSPVPVRSVHVSEFRPKDVVVALVNTPVEGVDAPIGVLLMVPPEMVRLSATRASANVPVQVEVYVSVSPEPVIVSPMFVSEVVANVTVGPSAVCPAGPIAVTAVAR